MGDHRLEEMHVAGIRQKAGDHRVQPVVLLGRGTLFKTRAVTAHLRNGKRRWLAITLGHSIRRGIGEEQAGRYLQQGSYRNAVEVEVEMRRLIAVRVCSRVLMPGPV